MSDILKKAKIPLIIIMVLILGFFVYNGMLKKDPPSDKLSDAPDAVKQENKKAPNQDFLPLLNLIKGVSFDEKFFDDVLFRSLIDFSEPVKEEQKGRDNPFAPGIITTFANTSGTGVEFDTSTSTTATTSSARPAATSTVNR